MVPGPARVRQSGAIGATVNRKDLSKLRSILEAG
jgi:hypothetical protein